MEKEKKQSKSIKGICHLMIIILILTIMRPLPIRAVEEVDFDIEYEQLEDTAANEPGESDELIEEDELYGEEHADSDRNEGQEQVGEITTDQEQSMEQEELIDVELLEEEQELVEEILCEQHDQSMTMIDSLESFIQMALDVNDPENIQANKQCYLLTTDLDLETLEWVPIGGTDCKFDGHFDGNNYRIDNLREISNKEVGGLFGYTTQSALIEQVTLTNVNIAEIDMKYLGSLVGNSCGTVSKCTAEGYMEGNSSHILGTIGGLIGYNGGQVYNCHANVEIKINKQMRYVGGLLGQQVSGGSVEYSSAYGNIQGTDQVFTAGGFIGYNTSSDIRECFATGAISNGLRVGGLIGRTSGGIIKDCYATGNAKGTFASGLIGHAENYAEILRCYSLGSANGFGNQEGNLVSGDSTKYTLNDSFYPKWVLPNKPYTNGSSMSPMGLSVEEMKTSERFIQAKWDFDQTWEQNPSASYPYPVLQKNRASVSDAPELLILDGAREGKVGEVMTITSNLPVTWEIQSLGEVETIAEDDKQLKMKALEESTVVIMATASADKQQDMEISITQDRIDDSMIQLSGEERLIHGQQWFTSEVVMHAQLGEINGTNYDQLWINDELVSNPVVYEEQGDNRLNICFMDSVNGSYTESYFLDLFLDGQAPSQPIVNMTGEIYQQMILHPTSYDGVGTGVERYQYQIQQVDGTWPQDDLGNLLWEDVPEDEDLIIYGDDQINQIYRFRAVDYAGHISDLSEEIIVNPVMIDFTAPFTLEAGINPNYTPAFVGPTFTIQNNGSPINLYVQLVTEVDDMKIVPPNTYADWAELTVEQSEQYLALGLKEHHEELLWFDDQIEDLLFLGSFRHKEERRFEFCGKSGLAWPSPKIIRHKLLIIAQSIY